MPSSESGVSDHSIDQSQIRSYVTVKQNKKVDNYKSDGELDDSDDEHYEKYKGKENHDRSKDERRKDYSGNSDDDKSHSRRERRYSGDEDNERHDNHGDKDDTKKSKSEKRGYYSDQSDNERYSKKSRRYESDKADDNYDDSRNKADDSYDDSRNRNHQRSRYRDDDVYYKDRRDKDFHQSHREEKKSYVDLDKPPADYENTHFDYEEKRKRVNREKRIRDKKSNDGTKGQTNDRKQTNEAHTSKENEPPAPKKPKIEDIFSKAGGAYIPPSKLRQMQEGITDKSSMAYQRMSWEALKKSIVGLINKVNASNMDFIVKELLEENVVRGRGLLAQSLIRAQVASPSFTNVYACLVSIINTRFPNIGELILRRLIIQFRKSFKRNDKLVCINSVKFIGHLVNQQVAHELLALEILTLLLHNHTGDSVEVAVSFLKDVGSKLLEVSPKGVTAVFERLRSILHDNSTEKRVQYMVEVVFAVRRDNFQSFPSIGEGLDKTEEDEQITHLLRLDDTGTADDILNVFKMDPDYLENEEKYKQIKSEIIGSDDSSDDGDDDDDDEDDDEDSDDEEGEGNEEEKRTIVDMTETNLVELRRLIYLTIQSSLDFEECAHKMMKFELKDGQQHEFCAMVVECCAQQRSYEKFYGLLAQRFCLLRKEFMEQFMIIFQEQYDTCHHLDTSKLRNTAKLFSHLLLSDAIPWTVVQIIKLNEIDTTSSSRIFIKILFQELAEYLGIAKLINRLKDPTIELCLDGVFPRDNPNNTRFAINYFTAIGLGGLTDDLREHLKSMPKVSTISEKIKAAALHSSSSSSDSSGSDSSDSDSSSSSSESEDEKREGKKNSSRKKRSTTPEEKESPEKSHKHRSEKSRTDKKSRESHNSKETSSSKKSRESHNSKETSSSPKHNKKSRKDKR